MRGKKDKFVRGKLFLSGKESILHILLSFLKSVTKNFYFSIPRVLIFLWNKVRLKKNTNQLYIQVYPVEVRIA